MHVPVLQNTVSSSIHFPSLTNSAPSSLLHFPVPPSHLFFLCHTVLFSLSRIFQYSITRLLSPSYLPFLPLTLHCSLTPSSTPPSCLFLARIFHCFLAYSSSSEHRLFLQYIFQPSLTPTFPLFYVFQQLHSTFSSSLTPSLPPSHIFQYSITRRLPPLYLPVLPLTLSSFLTSSGHLSHLSVLPIPHTFQFLPPHTFQSCLPHILLFLPSYTFLFWKRSKEEGETDRKGKRREEWLRGRERRRGRGDKGKGKGRVT